MVYDRGGVPSSTSGRGDQIQWNRNHVPRRLSVGRKRRVYVRSSDTTALIVDGTNVLSRAYASSLSLNMVKPRDVFGLWMDHLASFVRADVVMCVFDNPQNVGLGVGDYKKRKKEHDTKRKKVGRSGGTLWEYREYVAGKGASWHMAVSSPGEEADEYICRLSRRVVECKDNVRVVVASGDRDMQGVVDTFVFWLEILPCPTKQCPSGLMMHTLEDFVWREYFHPSQYGTFLALVGKRGGGVGVSETTAAKLVRSFGTVESMYRAYDDGRMKNWDQRVQNVFNKRDNDHIYRKLERNRNIFEYSRDADDVDVGWIDAVCGGPVCTMDAVHPFVSLHWACVEHYATLCLKPLESEFDVVWKPCMEGGLYVDVSIHGCRNVLYIMCIPVCGSWDDESLRDIVRQRVLKNDSSGWHDPYAVEKQCDSSMARYLRLIKKSGQDVLLLPSPVEYDTTL